MGTNVTTKAPTALSLDIVSGLVGGIADSRASTPIIGGKPLLRLLKSGVWVFGQQDDPVQEGSEWAVNPLSIKHGWCCWSSSPDPKVVNELLGEVLAPISDKKPPMPEPVKGYEWKEQRAFELKCTNGDDEGAEVLYKTNSIGGMRGVDNFLAELIKQLQEDPLHPVALVRLSAAPYQHPKFGQIFNPILTIARWADMAGEVAEDGDDDGNGGAAAAVAAKPEPEPVKAKAPLRPGAAPKRQRPAVRA
jgi:hypothetical protein